MTNGQHRYPGIRAFEQNEQELFFGRSQEIRQLYNQVKAQDLVVLFAKSGIGKSSLLNAGLVPLLELDDFQCIKARFQDQSNPPVMALKQKMAPFLDAPLLFGQTGKSADDATLWEYFRSCRFERFGETTKPVIIFDQFEEFFDHAPQNRLDFVLTVADILGNRLPTAIQEKLLAKPPEQRTEQDRAWFQPIRAKFIFAIRSDRLAQLDELHTEIPLILGNRYHLKPLAQFLAREAIVAPAKLFGQNFMVPVFSYREDALKIILDALTNRSGEIESFQIQLICQFIENQLFKNKNQYAAGEQIEVGPGIFDGKEGIQHILNDYYENALAELSNEEEVIARRFIEEGLILGERRVGVSEGVEWQMFQVNSLLLQKLLNSRIIRAENTHLGKVYELSHDALVAPVLESFKKRQLAEERARLEAQNLANQTQLARERKKRLRARFVAVISTVLTVLSLLSTWLVWETRREAIEAKNQAELALIRFQQEREQKQKLEAAQLVQDAEVYIQAGEFRLALEKLILAKNLAPGNKQIFEKITRCEKELNWK